MLDQICSSISKFLPDVECSLLPVGSFGCVKKALSMGFSRLFLVNILLM
jgi:hypothetical protein